MHGLCGIWGTWSLGLFATGEYGAPTPTGADTSSVVKGLFYGGGTDQLVGQIIGNAAIGGGVFVAAMLLMYLVKATGTLRVSKEGEQEGLDIHEHGGSAYPEQMILGHSAGGGVAFERETPAAVAYPRTT